MFGLRSLGVFGAVLALTIAGASGSSSPANERKAGGLIVFTRETMQRGASDPVVALYAVRPDGSGLRRLTTPCIGCGYSPRWSPDGSRIAYTGYAPRQEEVDLVLVNRNGSGKRVICDCPNSGSAWSPDGRRLALDDVTFEIIDSTSGRVVRRLLPRTSQLHPADPDWSPDGRQIAFEDDSATPSAPDVFLINSDGSGLRVVGRGADPRWSPDGNSLLFMRPGGESLYLLSRDAEHAKSLRFRPKQPVQRELAWSADGREIAYSAWDSIHILDLPTGKDRKVSLPPGMCTGGYWCADLDWQK